MRAIYKTLGAVAGVSILAACTGGQAGVPPASVGVDVQNTTSLQFRVGTARHANGAVYLNTLVTYRQQNGLSGTLFNTPSITGPAGFVVPAAQTTSTSVGSQPGTDAGTSSITGTPPTQPGTTAVATTFNQTGGAFIYGFAPANSTTTGAANFAQFNAGQGTPNSAFYIDDLSTIVVGPGKGNVVGTITGGGSGRYNNVYTQPLYLTPSRRVPFLLGPPAVPDFHTTNFPVGTSPFLGYDSGFTYFAVTPVAGTYTMNLTVPSANLGQNAASFTKTASLGTVTGLPPVVPPTITGSLGPGSGTAIGCAAATSSSPAQTGGGATFVVAPPPAGSGITNQLLYVVDVSFNNNQPTHYTINAGAGGTFVLSPTSGPSGHAPFCTGDSVFAYVVGSDYDVLAGAAPGNTQQNPTLPAQADITVSPIQEIAF